MLLILIIPFNVNAYSDYIVASGENIGIKVNTKGVIVMGNYNNTNDYLDKGDIIISVEDENDISLNLLSNYINNKDKIKIGYVHDGQILSNYLKVKNNKTGLYLKDNIVGIGTLTYIDPESKIYGALGHEIVENISGLIIEPSNGYIYDSKISSIKKSIRGVPGEKNAQIDNKAIGNIAYNTNKGIFGIYNKVITNDNLYKVAQPKEISTGNAYILTELKDNKVKKYEINILKISDTSNTKNILFEITDKRLEEYGGIVQGMSGSPIIQENKIIGAVTHVLVDNPKKGYGIFIVNMLKEGEKKK